MRNIQSFYIGKNDKVEVKLSHNQPHIIKVEINRDYSNERSFELQGYECITIGFKSNQMAYQTAEGILHCLQEVDRERLEDEVINDSHRAKDLEQEMEDLSELQEVRV